MELRLYCDRVEEGIAVLLHESGTMYEVNANLLPDGMKAEGKHYLCTVRDGGVVSAERVENPAAGENQKRLAALFRKSKNEWG